MSEFTLPNYEHLVADIYDFSEYQNNLVNQTFAYTYAHVQDSITPDDEYHMRSIILYVIKHFVKQFTISTANVIVIYCHSNERIYYKLTENINTFIEILTNYISINISQYGIFTEYWEPLALALVIFSGDGDNMIFYTEDIGGSILDNIIDRSFESNREEVIEKTYSNNHNHEIKIDGSVKRTDENKDCQLCYEKASYECDKCKYPICDKCMQTLKTSTGKCPCCQIYPLVLRKITDDGIDNDEITDNASNENANDNASNENATDNASNEDATDTASNEDATDNASNEDATDTNN